MRSNTSARTLLLRSISSFFSTRLTTQSNAMETAVLPIAAKTKSGRRAVSYPVTMSMRCLPATLPNRSTVVPSTPSAIYSAIIFLQRRLYVSSHFQSAKTSLRSQKRTLFSLRSIWHLFFSGMAARKHRDKKRPYRC